MFMLPPGPLRSPASIQNPMFLMSSRGNYSLGSVHLHHTFDPPTAGDSRAPCPALNALANHGYLPRNGSDISFGLLLHAIQHVYNLSYPLALLLTIFGFLTSGHISLRCYSEEELRPASFLEIFFLVHLSLPFPSWTLDLASLSTHGTMRIAHDASLVHPNAVPSTCPDSLLVADLLSFAQICSKNRSRVGLSLHDLGVLHVRRLAALRHPLDWFHEHIARGECGLAWCVMREREVPPQRKMDDPNADVIPLSKLSEWFGCEKLPDGWWDDVRPARQVGLLEALQCAKLVGM